MDAVEAPDVNGRTDPQPSAEPPGPGAAALANVTLLEEELSSKHSDVDTTAAAAGKYPELSLAAANPDGLKPVGKRELPAAAGGRGKPDEVAAAGGGGNPRRGGLLCPAPGLLAPVLK